MIVYLVFICPVLSQEPKYIPASDDEYSSQRNCETYHSLRYSVVLCGGDFFINHTSGVTLINDLIKTTKVVFTCLTKSTVTIPRDLFITLQMFEYINIDIQDCNINAKFIVELKEAMKWFPGFSEPKMILFVSGSKDYVLQFNNETLSDLGQLILLDISGINVPKLRSDLLPESLMYLRITNTFLLTLPEGFLDNNTNLKTLFLRNNGMKYLPKNIFKNLKNLQRLYLEENKLSALDFDLFHGLVRLQYLSLKGNIIPSLPDELFKNLSNLESLDLENNKINTYNKNAFSALHNLRLLNIGSNKLETLKSNMLKIVPLLDNLIISNNTFRDVDNVVFHSNLTSISLSHNKIPSLITKITFDNVSVLQNLRMRNCGIDKISENFLMGAKNISSLDLGQNVIHNLPLNFLSDSPNLKILFLDGNQIVEINSRMLQNRKLKSLFLHNNQISLVDPNLFENLTDLETLDLSNNAIRSVNLDTFRDLHNLTSLNLSHNLLTDVRNMLLPLRKLQYLNLSNNFIHQWSTKYTSSSRSLIELDLSSNRLGITFLSTYLPRLKFLNLANNRRLFLITVKVESITPDSSFVPTVSLIFYTPLSPAIKYIDVSNCTRQGILGNFRAWKSVRVLNYSHNNVTALASKDFLYASSNVTINLSFNNVTSILLKDTEIQPIVEDTVSGVNMYMNSRSLNCDCTLLTLLRYHQNDITILQEGVYVANISQSSLMCNEPKVLHNYFVEDIEAWSLHSLTLWGLCLL